MQGRSPNQIHRLKIFAKECEPQQKQIFATAQMFSNNAAKMHKFTQSSDKLQNGTPNAANTYNFFSSNMKPEYTWKVRICYKTEYLLVNFSIFPIFFNFQNFQNVPKFPKCPLNQTLMTPSTPSTPSTSKG